MGPLRAGELSPSGLPAGTQPAESLIDQPDAMQTSTLSADVAGQPPAAAPASAAPIVVPPADPSWAKPAFAALLGLTAVLYLWGLSASGWGNAFYAAAVQAGTVSWKAFFYGSSDAGNSITVDKTPLSLWVMVASARIFGVNSWSILAPQALMGVATVGALYASVRRWFGAAAALIAGLVLALTPVAVLMFRFDNPDAALVLLLTLGAYATIRALDAAATRAGTGWLVLAGVLVGLAFMAKMLQALLVVPAFALVYLLFAAVPVRRRIVQLLLSGVGLLVSAGWWIAVVELVPASMRPFIGGSQTNSVLDLMFGYNGFGRLTGDETGSVGGGNGWGTTGLGRMFNAEIGGQVAWLLPAALVLAGLGLWLTRRQPRTDRARAGLVLWASWLLITIVTFSFMAGIFHAYYTVALAPAIGALVGIGSVLVWRARLEQRWAAPALAVVVAGSSLWAWDLLGRSSDFVPWLRVLVLMVGVSAALTIAVAALLPATVATAAAVVGLVAVLAGPAAYSLQTASTVHTGSIPTAGPTVAGAGFGPGGAGGGIRGGMPGGAQPGQVQGGQTQGGQAQGGQGQGGQGQGGQAFGGRSFGPQAGNGTGARGAGGTARGGAGGMGGLLDATTPSGQMIVALKQNASSYTWAAAIVGANNAAGYQLASGQAVMPIGGFNGSDPSPTLAQFKQYVAQGRIHYFIGAGVGMRSDSGSSSSTEIAAWVTANYTATTIGTTTVYDLSAAANG
jgi:4-amino-4-deoxy-L-arabinose transferase-like glycosyltransferase